MFSIFCLLPSAFCLLLTAFCLLASGFSLPAFSFALQERHVLPTIPPARCRSDRRLSERHDVGTGSRRGCLARAPPVGPSRGGRMPLSASRLGRGAARLHRVDLCFLHVSAISHRAWRSDQSG